VTLVRTRIITLAVLASVLATCLFAVPLGAAVLDRLLGKERGHLVRLASEVSIDIAGEVEEGSPIDPDELTGVGDDGEDVTAAVFDEDGRRLAGPAPDVGSTSWIQRCTARCAQRRTATSSSRPCRSPMATR
jgi:hypothetical protein